MGAVKLIRGPYTIPDHDLKGSGFKSKGGHFKFTYPQSVIFDDPNQVIYAVTGRQIGKTELILRRSLYSACKYPGSDAAIIYPTYRLGKRISWRRLKEIATQWYGQKPKSNEIELTVELPNASRIMLIGADNPDSMVGLALHQLQFDEFTLLPNDQAYLISLPTVARYNAPRAYFGTPRGFNWAHDKFMKAKADPLQSAYQITSAQGGLISQEALALAKSSLSKLQYDQEYNGSFDCLVGQIYANFSLANEWAESDFSEQPDSEEYRTFRILENDEILVGMDFNINPMTAILGVSRIYRGEQIILIFGEIELMTSNTEEMATELRNRYPKQKVVVCPDPAGNSTSTKASAGITDITILNDFGFLTDYPRKAPFVRDRINNVQALLMSEDGKVRLFIHRENCPRLVMSLRGHVYKEGTSIPDKTQTDSQGIGLDHRPDALGYMLYQRLNILKRGGYLGSQRIY